MGNFIDETLLMVKMSIFGLIRNEYALIESEIVWKKESSHDDSFFVLKCYNEYIRKIVVSRCAAEEDMTMSKIRLDKKYVELSLLNFINTLLMLPEIEGIKMCGIMIQNNEYKEENVKVALDKSYHDCYSDSDMKLIVNLPVDSNISVSEYMNHPSRFGITPDKYLGFVKVFDQKFFELFLKMA